MKIFKFISKSLLILFFLTALQVSGQTYQLIGHYKTSDGTETKFTLDMTSGTSRTTYTYEFTGGEYPGDIYFQIFVTRNNGTSTTTSTYGVEGDKDASIDTDGTEVTAAVSRSDRTTVSYFYFTPSPDYDYTVTFDSSSNTVSVTENEPNTEPDEPELPEQPEQTDERTTYTLYGSTSINKQQLVNDGEGNYKFVLNDDYSGTIQFQIQSVTKQVEGQIWYGTDTEGYVLPNGENVTTVSEANRNDCYGFRFNKKADIEYTITFIPSDEGATVRLDYFDDSEPEEPKTAGYYVIGSIYGSENMNIQYLMEKDETDGTYSYTFESGVDEAGNPLLAGTVFFMINEYYSNSDNVYYGVDGGSPKPLSGSYGYGWSTNKNQIGSLYFAIEAGKRYTVKFDTQKQYITLVIEDVSAPFKITTDFTEGKRTVTPGLLRSLEDLISDFPEVDGATVNSVIITSFTDDLLERKKSIVNLSDLNTPVAEWSSIFVGLADDASGAIEDTYKYPDGEYVYQMRVRITDKNGKSHSYTVLSQPFTVNADGFALTLTPLYLVQYGENSIGNEGVNKYITLPTVEMDKVVCDSSISLPKRDETAISIYDVTNIVGSETGHSGVILMERLEIEDPNRVDYGDEETYKFTDQVLFRANVPEVKPQDIIKYTLIHSYVDFVEDDDVKDLIHEVEVKDEIAVDSQVDPNAIQSDGRFMAIAEIKNINTDVYKLVLYVKADYNEGTPDLVEMETGGWARKIESPEVDFHVVTPTPKFYNRYVDFSKGTETNDNDLSSRFTYKRFEDSNRPFQLKDVRYHNLCEYAEAIKPNVTNSLGSKMDDAHTGSFSYFFDSYLRNEYKKSDPFIMYKTWIGQGPLVLPEEFLTPAKGGLYDDSKISFKSTYMKTYNRLGKISRDPVYITDTAPADDNQPGVAMVTDSEIMVNSQNNIIEKFTINLQLTSEVVNTITYNGDNGDVTAELMHGTANDYFYVCVVDKNIDNGDSYDALAKTGSQASAENVYTAKKLQDGISINFTYNHTYNDKVTSVEQAKTNRYVNHLQVRISFLYPFWTVPSTGASESNTEVAAMAKKPSNLHGNVLKSQAALFDLKDEEISTGVETVETDILPVITAGAGYIETNGVTVDVYSLDGVQVAHGNNRINVAPGLYIVRTDCGCVKVMVR